MKNTPGKQVLGTNEKDIRAGAQSQSTNAAKKIVVGGGVLKDKFLGIVS